MSLILSNRIKEFTLTSGSGTITLGGANGPYKSFSSALSNGDKTYYTIVNGNYWEVGLGTYSSNTLSRDVIFSSSNSNNKINLDGESTVFVAYPAEKSLYKDENDQVVAGSSGVIIADGNPSNTSNVLYSISGSLYFNGALVDAQFYTAGDGLNLAGHEFSVDNTVIRSGDNISLLNNNAGYATVSYVDSRDIAVSGWADLTFLKSHPIIAAASSSNNSGRTYIQDILLDANGHITGIAIATETVVDTDTTYTAGSGLSLSGTTFNALTASTSSSGITILTNTIDSNQSKALTPKAVYDAGYLTAHPSISAAGSSNNSGRTYIQDILLDSNGHVTGIAIATETVVDTNTTYTAGTGLVLSGTQFNIDNTVIQSGDNITLLNNNAGYLTTHPSISAASSSNNSGRTYIQDILLDSNGHITGIATATETVVDTNTTYTSGDGLSLVGTTFSVDATVSRTGHLHTSSNITDFNTSVSGLLPVKDVVGGANVTVTSLSGTYTVAVTGQFGGLSAEEVDDRVAELLVAGSYIDLNYDDNANTLTIAATGLQPSGNYSLVGHTHTSSDITDFNASVSGLLPVKDITGGSNITVSSVSGTYTIAVTGQLGLTAEEVDDRVSNLLVGGNYISLDYNDGANTLTISATGLQPSGNYLSSDASYSNPSWLTSINANIISGIINSSNLPSYVDDVLEYAGTGNFPVTGSGGIIYVDTDENKTYRWGGSNYFQLTDGKATWGGIDGTLSNQTDVYNAIQSKASSGDNISIFVNDAGYLTSHPLVSAASSSDNSGRTYIQDILLDINGHITGIATATETVVDTNTTYTAGTGLVLIGTEFNIDNTVIQSGDSISFLTNDVGYLTSHPSISAATSSDNSGRTYIQDVLLDSNGHVTGITTATETVVDTNTTYTAGDGLDLSGTEFSVDATVSRSGHSHISSDITDFNTSVSGLLPVKDIVAGSNITVSSTSGIYTISSSGSGGGLYNIVEDTTPQLGGNLDLNSYSITGVGNVDISGNITAITGYFDVLDMNPLTQPPHLEGRLFYDVENHTITLYNDEPSISMQIGQELYVRVRNNKTYNIPNGSVVRLDGAHGNAAPTIALASADSEIDSQVVGLATHDIGPNSFGYVTTYGLVRGLDTDGVINDGDELFLAVESGQYTHIPPELPYYKISIGRVIVSNENNGSVFVNTGKRKLSGGDLTSATGLYMSGVPFVSFIADTDAGAVTTSSSFVYDSGNSKLYIDNKQVITSGNNISLLNNDVGYLTAHPVISAASSSDNSGRTYIQDVLLDSNGHVTGIATATETVIDTNTYVSSAAFNTSNGILTLTKNDATTVTVDLDGKYQEALTNPITGTGTTTYIPKWISSSGLGNSVINEDINGNIIIGTGASYYTRLTIAEDTNGNSIVTATSNSTDPNASCGYAAYGVSGYINLFQTANGFSILESYHDTSSSPFYIGTQSAQKLAFITNAAERVYIDTNGQVGIGTSSPTTILDVRGDVYASGNINVVGSGQFGSGVAISNQTASTIASFDANKYVTSLSTSTYPSLTELSYVKGVTSAIQTQLNSKGPVYSAGSGLTLNGTTFDANVNTAVQATSPNSVTSTANRTYAIQVDGSDNLVVNVPWTSSQTEGTSGTFFQDSTALTSGQQVFTVTGGYESGVLDVYVNGIKLVNNSDYTATDLITFSLSSAAASGDIVAWQGFRSFSPVSERNKFYYMAMMFG